MPVTPTAYVGFASIQHLGGLLSLYGARSVLLVTGGESYFLSGAEAALRPHLQLREHHRFFEFSENPKLEDVQSGIELYRRVKPDIVVAVGGGSAIDMAKLINVYAAEGVQGNVSRGVPLIAIPTTAGAGSEATQFATVYIDKLKHSISDEALLPNVTIVDPALTRSLPPLVTATSGMDALSQAIESYWCVNSTDESKRYAREAIGLIVPHLREAVHAPADEPRLAMAQGAHLAGKAINITRTTAPHALSYALTSRFGVPHGQAVSLTLPAVFNFNYGVTAEDTADPRGAAYVKRTLEDICAYLGCGTVFEASAMLRQLMLDIGLATTFAELKIDQQQAIEVVVREVNTERLVNNPRCLTIEHVLGLLGGL